MRRLLEAVAEFRRHFNSVENGAAELRSRAALRRAFGVTMATWILFSAPVRSEEVRPAEVEVEGVTLLKQSDVESAVAISPGEVLSRTGVVDTERALLDLYRARGFEETVIKTKLRKTSSGTVLTFQVIEGKPTRIASVSIETSDLKLKEKLNRQFTIAKGEIYDQDRLSVFRRQVLDALAVQEFVGAKVERTRATTVPVPAGEAPDSAARWVHLDIVFETGDRATFGFRNQKFFSREQIIKFINDQRAVGFGNDYISAIKNKIIEEYQNVGFPMTKIEVYPVENREKGSRHITFIIDEGPRVRFDQIIFDGNRVFSNEELEDELLRQASPVVQSGYFVQKDFEHAAELMVQYMKSKGYLSAKLVSVNSQIDAAKRLAKTTVYVYEGEQTLVQGIKIKGLTEFTEHEVLSTLETEVGTPLNLYAFSEGLEKLKVRYRNRGRLAFEIANEESDSVIQYSDENRYAEVFLEFKEGPKFKVSRIELETQIKTKPEVVFREIRLKPEAIIEEYRVIESESRLRRLGIFSNAAIRIVEDPERADHKILKVFITEADPGLAAIGTGLRNDLGFRLFGQLAYTNIWRRNHTLSLTTNFNRRIPAFWPRRLPFEYQAQVDYIWPWFLSDRTRVRPSFRLDKTQYLNFDVIGRTFSMNFDRPLLESPLLVAGFTYQFELIKQFNALASVDNQMLRIGSVIPSLRLDLRDDPLAPTRGYFAFTSYEVASTAFGSQSYPYPIGYTRWQFRNDYVVPFPKNIIGIFSFRTGIERSTVRPLTGDPNDPSGSIPLIKQFVLGGPTSLRGFKDQEINLQDRLIRGLASYVNYRGQIDFPFSGGLRMGPFVDAGNLTVDHYSFGHLRYGVGMGLRYYTPVGPVNFDLGFKVKPRGREDPYQFNFSIGIL